MRNGIQEHLWMWMVREWERQREREKDRPHKNRNIFGNCTAVWLYSEISVRLFQTLGAHSVKRIDEHIHIHTFYDDVHIYTIV